MRLPSAASIEPLVRHADADAGASMRRLVGGTGMLVAVALLLAVPLVIAVRGAARRRRLRRLHGGSTPGVDAWAESARRLKEGA